MIFYGLCIVRNFFVKWTEELEGVALESKNCKFRVEIKYIKAFFEKFADLLVNN